MKFVVRPELPTAALRSSQATLAAVDNSAPLATRRSPLKTRGNVVQTSGATSVSRQWVTDVFRLRSVRNELSENPKPNPSDSECVRLDEAIDPGWRARSLLGATQ